MFDIFFGQWSVAIKWSVLWETSLSIQKGTNWRSHLWDSLLYLNSFWRHRLQLHFSFLHPNRVFTLVSHIQDSQRREPSFAPWWYNCSHSSTLIFKSKLLGSIFIWTINSTCPECSYSRTLKHCWMMNPIFLGKYPACSFTGKPTQEKREQQRDNLKIIHPKYILFVARRTDPRNHWVIPISFDQFHLLYTPKYSDKLRGTGQVILILE